LREKGSLPRAYLRMDPDIDHTHPEYGWYVKLMCVANRQPERGRFKDRAIIAAALGRARLQRFIDRRDLVQMEDSRWYVVGWDEWQEGDWTVTERMSRMRQRRKSGVLLPYPSRNTGVSV
jgi:hypothetical protein